MLPETRFRLAIMSFQVYNFDIDKQNSHEIEMNTKSYHMKLKCKMFPFEHYDLFDGLGQKYINLI